jgi:hypothetical protein
MSMPHTQKRSPIVTHVSSRDSHGKACGDASDVEGKKSHCHNEYNGALGWHLLDAILPRHHLQFRVCLRPYLGLATLSTRCLFFWSVSRLDLKIQACEAVVDSITKRLVLSRSRPTCVDLETAG